MHSKTEIHQQIVYASAEIQNPKQMPKILLPLSYHIAAEAQTEKMQYKNEIHQQLVHASAEIQKPKQVPKIQFSVSQHISAEALIEKVQYKIRICPHCYMRSLKSRIPNTMSYSTYIFP